MTQKPALKKNQKSGATKEKGRYNSVNVGDIRRKQIISAVRTIIVRDGLGAVTIFNIAEELGTSRGVVIYHFSNKDEILHEALEAAMRDADDMALRIKGESDPDNLAKTVIHVAALAKTSSDWWQIYFAFLAYAHVNETYRKSLAWSDSRYLNALKARLGDARKAAIVLALMKGLAMQAFVLNVNVDDLVEDLEALLKRWAVEDSEVE